MKVRIRNTASVAIWVGIMGFGVWMWYRILTIAGRPDWTRHPWGLFRDNLEHLLLLLVSGLAVVAVSERMNQEQHSRLGWRSFWGWALLFAVLAGLFALLHLAGNTPPDSYPIYP